MSRSDEYNKQPYHYYRPYRSHTEAGCLYHEFVSTFSIFHSYWILLVLPAVSILIRVNERTLMVSVPTISVLSVSLSVSVKMGLFLLGEKVLICDLLLFIFITEAALVTFKGFLMNVFRRKAHALSRCW
jgi:hypothetical protein